MQLRIESVNNITDDLRDLQVVYGKNAIIFSGDVYPRATRGQVKSTEIFKPINEFFTTLKEESRAGIFNAYSKMEEILTHVVDLNARNGLLINEIAKLYQFFDYEQMEYWVKFRSGIQLPPELALTAYEGAAEERTYLADDYWPLITLALALRPMVPIWNQYIPSMKDVFGNDFKEYRTLKLLWNSWILESKPCLRLSSYLHFTYKEQTANNKKIDFSPLLSGLPSDSIPTYLLSLALIRRLAIGNLYPQKKEDSLVANVYNYIFKNVLAGIDRNFSGMMHEKINPDRGNEEDNTSIAENYKVKTLIPDSIIVQQDIEAERTYVVATKVDPTIPTQLIDECLRSIKFLEKGDLQTHYVPLAQWTIASVINPDSISDLNKRSQICVFAVTQAILWHWQFYHLAVLMTATPDIEEDSDVANIGDIRSRISDTLRDRLVLLYPHYYPVGGSNPPSEEKQRRQNNVGIIAVEELARKVQYNRWCSNAPKALNALAGVPETTKRFSLSSDLRNQLAELVVKLNTL